MVDRHDADAPGGDSGTTGSKSGGRRKPVPDIISQIKDAYAELRPAERRVAPQLHHALERLAAALRAGDRDFPALEQLGLQQLELAGFRPDYVSIRRAADLSLPGRDDAELVVLAAAWLGRARLIDNLRIVPGTDGA